MKIAVEPKVPADTAAGDYTNLEQWWSQQGGAGLKGHRSVLSTGVHPTSHLHGAPCSADVTTAWA